jgi:hypothetical protein
VLAEATGCLAEARSVRVSSAEGLAQALATSSSTASVPDAAITFAPSDRAGCQRSSRAGSEVFTIGGVPYRDGGRLPESEPFDTTPPCTGMPSGS